MAEQQPLPESLARFIEGLGLYFEEFGLPRIGGRLLGLLMITDRPLPLDEIASRLLVSRASVSTNARLVVATGLVERVGIPGDRRDYYAFGARAWDAIIEVDIDGVRRLRSLAAEALAGLPERDPACARLDAAIEFLDFYADELAGVLDRWRQRRQQQLQRSHAERSGAWRADEAT